MPMIARSPDCLSWPNTTCSWPVSLVNTPMWKLLVTDARFLVGSRRIWSIPAGWCRTPRAYAMLVFGDREVSNYIAWYVRSVHGVRTEEPANPFEAFAYSRAGSRCHPPPSRGTIRSVAANFAAYLRVYEPLTAFDRDRQLYWRRYVKEGRAVAPADGPVRQRTAVLEALGAGWSRLPDLPEDAYVLETEDTLLVCPWNLRVRIAEAALTARDGVPPVLA